MSAYLNHHSGQLFDVVPDVLGTVSQTAADIERLYNQFSGSGSGAIVAPDQYPPPGNPEGSNIPPDDDGGGAAPAASTDYTPYIIGAGVVAIATVALWLILKK